MMYQAKVNDQNQFQIEIDKNLVKVNEETIAFDAVSLSGGHSHVLYKDKSYNVEIIAYHEEEKSVEVKVNGNVYFVAIKDQYDQLLEQLGLDTLQINKVQEIKAPMPGLVLNLLVKVGQEVNKEDNLLVLEAMKMENIIKSTAVGTVKSILVVKGDKVEKNAVLLRFS
ncbi:biotin carboxyl carrier protein [Pedobacter sp. CG_S7]|uniref:acetyl-CoA carboxylase biotin carboxyl carrier protein subunit n=1 Tax=Pedobacter sp. CG_S7 TaxID=3143930 RepID=UPI00339978AF